MSQLDFSGLDGHVIDWSIRWLVSSKTLLVMSHVVHLLNVFMVLCSYVVMRLSSLLVLYRYQRTQIATTTRYQRTPIGIHVGIIHV